MGLRYVFECVLLVCIMRASLFQHLVYHFVARLLLLAWHEWQALLQYRQAHDAIASIVISVTKL